ncbi:MAG: TRAM domain-containing protein [bacterium]
MMRRLVIGLLAAVGVAMMLAAGRMEGAAVWAAIGVAALGLDALGDSFTSPFLARAGAGVLAGWVAALALSWALDQYAFAGWPGGRVLLLGLLGFVGATVALRWPGAAEGRRTSDRGGSGNGRGGGGVAKLLDTSVIIDGRIAEVCDTGFLEGTFYTPRFVLQELQRIADSSDPLKRNRGRRGLDILNRMQKSRVRIEVLELDAPETREVDEKLLIIGKQRGWKIITNDFNLNKVAEIHGVAVLNINDLANALKPAVLPGELLTIRVIKEGKEAGQGIGYLDDGTMVVVDNGKVSMGQKVEVVVTSALQTAAGRMIFAKKREEAGDIITN